VLLAPPVTLAIGNYSLCTIVGLVNRQLDEPPRAGTQMRGQRARPCGRSVGVAANPKLHGSLAVVDPEIAESRAMRKNLDLCVEKALADGRSVFGRLLTAFGT